MVASEATGVGLQMHLSFFNTKEPDVDVCLYSEVRRPSAGIAPIIIPGEGVCSGLGWVGLFTGTGLRICWKRRKTLAKIPLDFVFFLAGVVFVLS